ncbi:unnamed protein product [Commensalibacter communis]|nr:unnamed protein product [Commensalibacter communis]
MFGEIYFQLDQDAFFPDEHWDDFIIILLNEWIQKAIACFHGSKIRCIFMEGSCHYVMTPQNNLFLIGFFINNKQKYRINLEQIAFLEILKEKANLAIRTLFEKKIVTPETIELHKNFNLFAKKFIKRHLKLFKHNSTFWGQTNNQSQYSASEFAVIFLAYP